MTIVIDIVTNGSSGAPASPSTPTGSIWDRRRAAPSPRKAQLEKSLIHESYPIHKSHPVSRLRRFTLIQPVLCCGDPFSCMAEGWTGENTSEDNSGGQPLRLRP